MCDPVISVLLYPALPSLPTTVDGIGRESAQDAEGGGGRRKAYTVDGSEIPRPTTWDG